MFWFELAARAAEVLMRSVSETVAKTTSEHAMKGALSPKRHFARTLFAFYEDLKTYRKLCDEALSILERPRSWVMGGLAFGASKELGAVSKEMKRVGGALFASFFHEGFKELVTKRAMSVLEVHDRELASLLKAVMRHDMELFTLGAVLSESTIDWHKQTMRLMDLGTGPVARTLGGDAPGEEDAPGHAAWSDLLWKEWSAEYSRNAMKEESERDDKLFTLYDLQDQQAREELRERYRTAIKQIDEVTVKFGNFLKSTFSLEDMI